MKQRIEHDSLGNIEVPANKYWGAQTQRSLINFNIGQEKMPYEIIQALAIIKMAAAKTNVICKKLNKQAGDIIIKVAKEIIDGKLDGNFPLSIWQTGSGTQTNMNVNEVIANRSNTIIKKKMIHPNDHVNMSQSSNDVFPSAITIAGCLAIQQALLPSIKHLIDAFKQLEKQNISIIKVGRTHLQDATPISLAQEISG
jgi:fumarate hydratase class II